MQSAPSLPSLMANLTASPALPEPHIEAVVAVEAGVAPAEELVFRQLEAQAVRYLKPEDVARLQAAFALSAQAHAGQMRTSGDPYISHPLAVASILADWHLDAHVLIAGLLHDVMEDCDVTKDDIAQAFGKTVANLVDGVSKLDKLEFSSHEEAQAENYRKMFLAMAHDVRVILIKLADRLHNMRTLDAVRPEKRRRVARETLEIFAPIANRLGLNTLYRELQELSFKHSYPMRYRVLAKALKGAQSTRRQSVDQLVAEVEARLPVWQVEANVYGREKHLYGIYRKMQLKRVSLEQVLDVYGCRIVVKDVPSCYLALGVLHTHYKPVPGKFKDYVALPKANGYQSLHTTVIGAMGMPVEVQIRTRDMHAVAESGLASHWLYKDESESLSDLQKKTHNWLQSLLALQMTAQDSSEFLEHVKVDLFPGEVFVFSPKGKIFNLPRGATAVDFAYAVHSDVGNRCVSCRINNTVLPLRTELKNGDQVEITTASHGTPNPVWLSYVRTGKARSEIRHFLKTLQQDEAIALGERLLQQALRPQGQGLTEISPQAWEKFLREHGLRQRQDVFAEVGLGKRLPAVVARRLFDLQQMVSAGQGEIRPRAAMPMLIHGGEGMAVQMARCCRPIPGDPIVGMIRKDQGLEVHIHDCAQLTRHHSAERDRWVDVAWETTNEPGAAPRLFDVELRVLVEHRRGVLAQVAAAMANQNSNIQSVSMDGETEAATPSAPSAVAMQHGNINFVVQVSSRLHLAGLMRAVRRIPEVVRVLRVRTEKKI